MTPELTFLEVNADNSTTGKKETTMVPTIFVQRTNSKQKVRKGIFLTGKDQNNTINLSCSSSGIVIFEVIGRHRATRRLVFNNQEELEYSKYSLEIEYSEIKKTHLRSYGIYSRVEEGRKTATWLEPLERLPYGNWKEDVYDFIDPSNISFYESSLLQSPQVDALITYVIDYFQNTIGNAIELLLKDKSFAKLHLLRCDVVSEQINNNFNNCLIKYYGKELTEEDSILKFNQETNHFKNE